MVQRDSAHSLGDVFSRTSSYHDDNNSNNNSSGDFDDVRGAGRRSTGSVFSTQSSQSDVLLASTASLTNARARAAGASNVRSKCSFYEEVVGVSAVNAQQANDNSNNNNNNGVVDEVPGEGVEEGDSDAATDAVLGASVGDKYLLETKGRGEPRVRRQWLLGTDMWGFASPDANATMYRQYFFNQGSTTKGEEGVVEWDLTFNLALLEGWRE